MRYQTYLLPLLALAACAPQKSSPPSPLTSQIPVQTKKVEPNFQFIEHEVVQDSKEDGISATCLYWDGNLIGQTTPGLKSREKTWEGLLPPGNHLMEFQRWFFPGDTLWVKEKKDQQPRKRFVRVIPGSKTLVSLKYSQGGKKYAFDISKKALAAGTTQNYQLTTLEKMVSRLGFCPLSPDDEGSSLSRLWTKKRTLTITNSGPKLTNTTLEVNIPHSKDMMSDFQDLRFFDAQGNSLPHWIKDYSKNRYAKIMLKIPSLPSTGVTLTVYYGNPYAQHTGDPKDVFLVYDEFEEFKGVGCCEGNRDLLLST